MTVFSAINRISFAGNGVTVAFNTSPLIFFAASDLEVYIVVNATGVATLKTITTHYSVTGGVGLTGIVTMVTAPASGETLLILRVMPLVQGADFVNNDISDAEVAEDVLDKGVMISQQLQEQTGRTIRLPVSETSTASLTTLPFDRASKFLAFDASKNLIAASGTPGAVPVSLFMETLLDDLTAIAARATLGTDQKGADIASAATTDLGAVAGRFHDITGTTTIASFGTVSAGVWKILKYEDALTITHNATSLILLTGANRVTAVGDVQILMSEGSGNWRELGYGNVAASGASLPFIDTNPIVIGSADATKKVRFEVDGLATGTTRIVTVPNADLTLLEGVATQAEQETATNLVKAVVPGRQQFHPSAVKATVRFNSAGTIAFSYNITSITDVGVGDWNVVIATDFSGAANYAGVGTCGLFAGAPDRAVVINVDTTASEAGTFYISAIQFDVNRRDPDTPNEIHVIFVGDQ